MGNSWIAMAEGAEGAKVKVRKGREISVEEFLKHNQPNDLWMCIGGNVMDITDYKNDHPGSDTILLEKAGMDATRDFIDVGHTPDAKAIRDKLVIGYIPDDQLPNLPGYDPADEDDTAEGGGSNMMMIIAVLVIMAGLVYKLAM